MLWTNRGLRRLYGATFRGETLPTNFYLVLCTADNVPSAQTDKISELTEIAGGNGYTAESGIQLNRNTTDFDSLVQDDLRGLAYVDIANKTVTASGGSVPSSGNGVRYIALTDDNAEFNDREVWAYFDLGYVDIAPNGATIPLNDLRLRLKATDQSTVEGLAEMLDWTFRGATAATNLYLALITAATTPDFTTETMADVTEITNGNGYDPGGFMLNRDSTDFPTLTEDDVDNFAEVTVKNVTIAASGGAIPPSGDGATYLVLTDDNATVANRIIFGWWSVLGAPKTAPDGTQFSFVGMTINVVSEST